MPLANRIASGALGLLLGLVNAATLADVVAVVSSGSPATTLSRNQVADIFLGKLSRLPNGEEVHPIDHAEGSAVRDEFYATFAGKSAAQLKAHWAKIIFTGRGHPPETVSNSIEVKKLLARHPQAIGYIEKSAVDGSVRVLGAE
jgi:ABC-type phosphate transport system substrate-binding protein